MLNEYKDDIDNDIDVPFDVFLRWWMRLLLPLPGRLSMSDFVAPLPSQEGCEALEARLKQVEEQGVKQEVKQGT